MTLRIGARAGERAARAHAAHAGIYNAAWLVRDAYFGADARRQRAVKAMLVAMFEALQASSDAEAVLFAAADALYASSLGVPWEA